MAFRVQSQAIWPQKCPENRIKNRQKFPTQKTDDINNNDNDYNGQDLNNKNSYNQNE